MKKFAEEKFEEEDMDNLDDEIDEIFGEEEEF